MAPGSWSGNETVWRMTLDLNHLIYFGPHRPKHVLNIVDGIIGGEGDGPLRPLCKPAGVLLAGENPAYVDAAIARLIGYNPARVPTVYHALHHRRSQFAGPPLQDAPVHFVYGLDNHRAGTWPQIESLHFQPPKHWRRAMCQT